MVPAKLDLTVRIGDLVMQNPVGVASGTFGYGEEYEDLVDIDCLGALYTKAVTPEPRPGNPAPRLADTPAGMLNSIGLANPGLDAFIADKLPRLRARRCAVIVNVAGGTEDDYLRVLDALEAQDGIVGYEINISCPNVAHGGLSFGTDPVQVERLTRRLVDAVGSRAMAGAEARCDRLAGRGRRPLIVKLSPNVTDIAAIAKAAEAGGAVALSCINTLVGMVIDIKTKRPVLAMGSGGLSGPAIRPVGVAMVYKASHAVSIPVIGLGGISDADDALQYLLAGAVAIQVGTAIFSRPEAPLEILAGIREFMEREGIEQVADIRKLLR
ncbi:MAG: dihydroorotate dehydrogenase [Spirochaetae bacterium HGW-Spirochaetae-7]|jgi:dihydroorotate dehydrogenase (NAD+) catalytic subunit|nr:MAG: dihydroorotate dehydrogenase [Spirochaetae bacterium HGW-Spirochaetae-7]